MCAKSFQSCLTLCDPTDCSLPDSSAHGSCQARILEWVAVLSSTGSSGSRDRICVSYISWQAGSLLLGPPAAAAAKSRQSCPTLCDPIDGSPPGSSVPEILQARVDSPCMKVESESEVARSCPTLRDPMNCSLQAPPSMGFSRQEYWSGVPLPSPIIKARHEILHIVWYQL